MKKPTAILIFLTISLAIIGQDYIPMPKSNAIWNIITTNEIYNPHPPYKYRYGIDGDTLINDTLYSKVLKIFDDTTLFNSINLSYIGALREDSNKCVFYRDMYWPVEEVKLYDFSLNLGDTIHYSFPYSFYKTLISIDSTLINGSYRKRYSFNDNDIWIQGIGSVEGVGLLHPISEYVTNGDVVTVACVKQNNVVLYLDNPLCDKCFCTLYTGNVQYDKFIENIELFPNPIKSKFTIKVDSKEIEKYSLCIMDITGVEIISINNIYTPEMMLNLNFLKRGLYLVEIYDSKEKRYLKKIIKE